ncbi:MAG TPA: class I SAM-dependent RNA methyltransferase [Aliiroseovarius sp.]|nr:class I SAM-dependent RNA methyltransferase [Aliiroseovarius sp.]
MSDGEVTVHIERLGHQGDGIASGPVYVARALPGEVVSGVVENGRMFSPKIVTPVKDRVRPPCRHYKSCGGCSLQHASDSFVEAWKIGVVEHALAAQGLDAPIRGIQTSPKRSRRRATLGARRLKKGAQVGFHGFRSDTICEILDCHLLDPALLAVLPIIQAITTLGASRKARLAITLNKLDDGIDLAVKGGKPFDRDLSGNLAQLVGKHPEIVRLTWDGEVVGEFSPATVTFGRAKVTPPPGAFLQATKAGETALVGLVQQAVGDARRIVDLFAGCGTFSLPLAENAIVHAVEGEKDMVASLENGWRKAQGLKAVTVEARDLFQRPLLHDELDHFDAVVLDPPRAGAEAQVAEIGKSGVKSVAMVSCNPVTFARDARVLTENGYLMEWINVVDQFRWSPHIEVVALLTKEG